MDRSDQPRGHGRRVGATRRGRETDHSATALARRTSDRLTGLVKSAIGLDEKRGDQVNVVPAMRFVGDEVAVVRRRRSARSTVSWRNPISCNLAQNRG